MSPGDWYSLWLQMLKPYLITAAIHVQPFSNSIQGQCLWYLILDTIYSQKSNHLNDIFQVFIIKTKSVNTIIISSTSAVLTWYGNWLDIYGEASLWISVSTTALKLSGGDKNVRLLIIKIRKVLFYDCPCVVLFRIHRRLS